MNIGVVLLILAVVVVVVILIANPFLQNPKSLNLQPDQRQSSLLAEKERLLQSIQELEFDHQSGKIPDPLFENQRKLMMVEAAGVFEKLGKIQPDPTSPQPKEDGSDGSKRDYDQLEELIAKRRVVLQQKSKGFCQKCGTAVLETDRYCPKCGTVLPQDIHE